MSNMVALPSSRPLEQLKVAQQRGAQEKGFILGDFYKRPPLQIVAADAINAYAPIDNDLWCHYCFKMDLEIITTAYIVSRSTDCATYIFKMDLEIITTAYIVSRSTDCPTYIFSGVFVFVVGSFTYGERIVALQSAS